MFNIDRNATGGGLAQRGFSLIEILVVLVLVAVMAMLLFMLTESARETANKTVSAANLRRIGVAVNLYALTSEGNRIPPFWANRFSSMGRVKAPYEALIKAGLIDSHSTFHAPNDNVRLPTLDHTGWLQNPQGGQMVNQYSSYSYFYIEPGTRDGSPGGASAVESFMKPRFHISDDPMAIFVWEDWETPSMPAFNRDGGVNVLRRGGSVDYITRAQIDKVPSPNNVGRAIGYLDGTKY